MKIVIICSVLLVTAASVVANDGASGSMTAVAEAGERHLADSADHVRIIAIHQSIGEPDKAVVQVMIDPGYHINANPASLDYLIPTTLNVTSPTPLRVIYPHPVKFTPKFADDPLDVYEGTIDIVAEFARGLLASGPLLGSLTVQACTDQICLPPADLALPQK